jgi:hypothetical protein
LCGRRYNASTAPRVHTRTKVAMAAIAKAAVEGYLKAADR